MHNKNNKMKIKREREKEKEMVCWKMIISAIFKHYKEWMRSIAIICPVKIAIKSDEIRQKQFRNPACIRRSVIWPFGKCWRLFMYTVVNVSVSTLKYRWRRMTKSFQSVHCLCACVSLCAEWKWLIASLGFLVNYIASTNDYNHIERP